MEDIFIIKIIFAARSKPCSGFYHTLVQLEYAQFFAGNDLPIMGRKMEKPKL
jgi:hypothetical protein